jgi:hypothetical protein
MLVISLTYVATHVHTHTTPHPQASIHTHMGTHPHAHTCMQACACCLQTPNMPACVNMRELNATTLKGFSFLACMFVAIGVFVTHEIRMSLLYLSFSGGQHDLKLEPLGLQME